MAKTPRMNIYGVRLTAELVRELEGCDSSCLNSSRVGRVARRDFGTLVEAHERYCRLHQLATLGLAEFRQYLPREGQPWGWYAVTALGAKWLKKYRWMCRRDT